jgi:hypothetical protein
MRKAIPPIAIGWVITRNSADISGFFLENKRALAQYTREGDVT